MTVLCADDFEAGDFAAAWTHGVVAAGSAAEVIAGAKKNGTYGAHFLGIADAALGEGFAAYDIYSTFVNTKYACIEGWVQLKTLSPTGHLCSIDYWDGASWWLLAALARGGGVWAFVLQKRDLSGYYTSDPITVTIGTWYRFKITYDTRGTNPVARMWWDGVLVEELTDTEEGTPLDAFICAITATTNETTNMEAWYDDVTVSDQAIIPPASLMGVGR
jgi:hypothetical protein